MGPTGVATCAHGIYNRNTGWYKNIRVYTLADNGRYGERILASFATIGGEYNETDKDDWGVLELSREPRNNYYFSLEPHESSNDVLGDSVTATGYTSLSEPLDMTEFYQKESRGKVLGILGKALLPLATSCSATYGMSGGPLILDSNKNAIAINVRKYKDMTEHMLINNWLYGAFMEHSGF